MPAGGGAGTLIRPATVEDADVIAALLTQLGYPVDAAPIPRRLERLAQAGDEVVVAEVDGRVVGLAQLHVAPALEDDAPAGKLAALVVGEEERGSGVGRALVEAMEASARQRGCGVLFLTTALRRSDAHAFYERIGFTHTGRRYGKTLTD